MALCVRVCKFFFFHTNYLIGYNFHKFCVTMLVNCSIYLNDCLQNVKAQRRRLEMSVKQELRKMKILHTYFLFLRSLNRILKCTPSHMKTLIPHIYSVSLSKQSRRNIITIIKTIILQPIYTHIYPNHVNIRKAIDTCYQ